MTAATQGTNRRWWSVVPARTDTTPIGARRAYGEVLGVWAVFFLASVVEAGFSLAGGNPSEVVRAWGQAIPGAIDQFATLALCIALPLLLVAHRQPHPPRLGVTREGLGAGQWLRISAWALLALYVGTLVTSALATGSFPLRRFTYPGLVLDLTHALQAGPIEEIAVLAFTVTTLEQARRPRREILVVALLLRCSYHIYYGPGVVGIVVWASVFLWLFLRFRTVLPLIVVHSTWDTVIFLGDHWRPVYAGAALLYLGVPMAAPITWLVARSNGGRPPPGGVRQAVISHPGPVWGPPARADG